MKGSDVGFLLCVIVIVESRDDEENEIHKETELLHSFSPHELIVDEEGCQIVTTEQHTDVHEVPKPAG